jgi:Uma2 family endonuclease
MEASMSATTISVPPLRHGERLSPEEFMRRYEAMPDVKAELLNGVVYMASPVSATHAAPHGDLMTWLGVYKAFTPGVDSGDNGTIRLPLGSVPQPDVYLRIQESHGGKSHIDPDRYVAGVPELLGEVAMSSVTYDGTVKMPIYREAGVAEFILWRIEDRAVDWCFLNDGDYEELPAGPDGIIRSKTFPGLWLDVDAMIRGDLGTVLRVLQQGIAAPEHQEFVAELQNASRLKP